MDGSPEFTITRLIGKIPYWMALAGGWIDQPFPLATTPQECMFAIDRLIHDFHLDLAVQLPNRPAANNLIEGSLQQVIALQDQLSYGNDEQAKAQWQETVAIRMKRRWEQ